MFKNIDGYLTTIFNKTKDVGLGFDFANDNLEKYIKKFADLNSKQNFGDDWTAFLQNLNSLEGDYGSKLADHFEELSKQGASARASVESVYTVILDGNTKGFSNVRSLIKQFNDMQGDSKKQEAFAKAIGHTNKNLGDYLGHVKDGKADMLSYGKAVATTTIKMTAATVASRALNAALNATIIGLVTTAISALTSWLTELANADQVARDKANEATDAFKNETDAIDGEIEKITELRKKLDEGNLTYEESADVRAEQQKIPPNKSG